MQCPECESTDVTNTPGTLPVCQMCDWTGWDRVPTPKGGFKVSITQTEYRKQKTALTRAVNSGDPLKVLATCQATLDAWTGSAWPDDWHRWRNAADDALGEVRRNLFDLIF